MGTVWLASFALLLVGLIRRHGWEYVPLVVFLGLGRWWASDLAFSEVADGLSLLSFAGVWIVSSKTQS